MAVILAGCAGVDPAAEDALSKVSDGITDEGYSSMAPGAPKGTGNVVGRVRDDVNFGVKDAAITMFRTPFFTRTNESGGFQFIGVQPGTYMLRVDPPIEFSSVEDEVTVVAGSVTHIEIRVLPKQDRGPGYRPHLHDYWANETRYNVMDHDYDFKTGDAYHDAWVPLYGPNYSDTTHRVYLGFPLPPGTLAHPNIIIPGTASIEITLKWGADVRAKKMGLWYVTANSSTVKNVAPKPMGEVLTIPVERNEWDSPHQSFTMWQFFLDPGNSLTAGRMTNTGPVIINGKIHITVNLIRGHDLDWNEPHTDYWGNRTVLSLPFQPKTTTCGTRSTTSVCYVLSDGSLVPPGTARILVNMTWKFTGTYGPIGEARNDDWKLRWRTGQMDPANHNPEQFKTKSASPCGNRCKSYDVALQPTETDAFYQKKSNWAFEVYLDPPVSHHGFAMVRDTWESLTGVEITLTLVAFKVPEPG